MTTKAFGPNEEQQLMRACKSAVDMVASGLAPDEALAKVARDSQLHPDSVSLLVSAYNVGQQTHKRNKCADANGGASCLVEPHPIARIENVQAKLYPNREKLASFRQAVANELVDDCYSMQPVELQFYEQEKIAELRAIKLPANMPPRRPAGEFIVNAFNRLKMSADKQASEIDHALYEQHDQMLYALDDVCRYFKQSADRRISLAEVEYNSSRLFGSDAKGIFDVVGIRCKEARANDIVSTTTPCIATQSPYSLVKHAIDQARQYVKDEITAKTTKAKIASEVAKADPFAEPARVYPSLLEAPDPLPYLEEKEAGFLASLAGTAAGTSSAMKVLPMGKPTSELVDDATDQLNDPNHLAKMRAVQARAMLGDLMANDDVISGYDPSEVTDAYNEITQFSPNLATQAAAVRGLLRRRLTGGVLEAHDAQQLADINKSLGRDNNSQQSSPAKK